MTSSTTTVTTDGFGLITCAACGRALIRIGVNPVREQADRAIKSAAARHTCPAVPAAVS